MYAEESVTIDRPCAEVFDVIADLDQMPQWRSNVVRARWRDGDAPGTGTENLAATTQLLGQRFDWTCDVTVWDPPRAFAYVARSGRQEVTAGFAVEPQGDGCRVTMSGGGEVPGGRIGAIAAPVLVKALLRENRRSLRRLKSLIEGRP